MNSDETQERPRTRRRRGLALGVGLVALGIASLWWQRAPLATQLIDRELARRGVPATYSIARLDAGGAVLAGVIVGDPAAPDLVASKAGVRISWSLSGASIGGIALEDAIVRGKLDDKGLSFGTLDRLRPAPSGKPFTLPDLGIRLKNVRLKLATPGGMVGAAAEGSGNLAHGFVGRLALSAPQMTMQPCRLQGGRGLFEVKTADRTITASGRAGLTASACGEARSGGGSALLYVSVPETLNAAEGRINAIARRFAYDGGDIGKATLQGGFSLDQTRRKASFDGLAGWEDLRAPLRLGEALRRSADGLAGTPPGPIARAIAAATARALMRSDGSVQVAAAYRNGSGRVSLSNLGMRAATGAQVTGTGRVLSVNWPANKVQLDGRLALSGGWMPEVRVDVQPRPGGGWRMLGDIAPYTADGARLAVSPLRFDWNGRDGRLITSVTMDGPLADGSVKGLVIPLDMAVEAGGGLRLAGGPGGCMTIGVQRLDVAGVRAGATRLPLCARQGGALFAMNPAGRLSGGAAIGRIALNGTLGDAPMTAGSDGGRIGFAGSTAAPRVSFALNRTSVRIRQPGGETRLGLGGIDGASASGGGFEGRLAQADGAIANVPLLVDQASGRWRYRADVLAVEAPFARVRDATPERRFEPVSARDIRLTLKQGVIDGNAVIAHPPNGKRLALVTLTHDLSAGRGNAVLDVPKLVFGDDLQPEALTPLTRGVIANVGGAIEGRGHIRWSAAGVASDGTFETDGIGLSAAFGQVHNIKGKIVFDDLLGMTTPPGQTATIGEMNPGVAVKDGIVRYQLLPEQHVKVEEGRWPFSGGELLLEPTVLDFSKPSDRIFALTVVGLDAAQFIQQFDFRNFAVTGLFDGRLPLLFTEKGGRIVGGRLVARQQGGTLAYVGEVSEAQLGGAGKLAFDALKSMKYNALVIEMDGELDGEIISSVLFNGSNQQPVNPTGSALPVKATGLPFKFNITVRAPFRALLSTAESFTDVRTTVRQALPVPAAEVPGSKPVKPTESEGVR